MTSPQTAGVIRTNRWISRDSGDLASIWFSPPAHVSRREATVVIVPGFGYPELVAHDGWLHFGSVSAAAGFQTVMFDLPGCGNSDETTDESAPMVTEWGNAVAAVVREAGGSVVLVGARLGAFIAAASVKQLDDADEADGFSTAGESHSVRTIASMVVWAPVVSGRQFVRELTLGAGAPPHLVDEDRINFAGFRYPRSLLSDVAARNLSQIASGENRPLLLVNNPKRLVKQDSIEKLDEKEWLSTVIDAPETSSWLDESSETSVVPVRAIGQVVDWLVAHHPETLGPNARPAAGPPPVMESASRVDFLRLGSFGLAATVHRPTVRRSDTAIVLMNSGVERSVGPGDAWVAAARRWCAEGFVVLRADHSSTGESGQWDGQARHNVYGTHGPDDLRLVIAAALAEGCSDTILIGICSSAFSVLQLGPHEHVRCAVAINPQLYRIGTEPGVIEETTNVAKYRLAKLDNRLGLRKKAHAARAVLGHRHDAFKWLAKYENSPTRVSLLFAEGDRGLRFLERESGRALTDLQREGGVSIVRFAGLDHALHNVERRSAVMDELDRLVKVTTDQLSERELSHA